MLVHQGCICQVGDRKYSWSKQKPSRVASQNNELGVASSDNLDGSMAWVLSTMMVGHLVNYLVAGVMYRCDNWWMVKVSSKVSFIDKRFLQRCMWIQGRLWSLGMYIVACIPEWKYVAWSLQWTLQINNKCSSDMYDLTTKPPSGICLTRGKGWEF